MHTTELLSRGVERGVITDTQRASLLALGAERESPREAARGFNAITVAYGAGVKVSAPFVCGLV